MEFNFQVEHFDEFVDINWPALVEYVEEQTGESYSGEEPLLTQEAIVEEAKELWNEYWSKYK